MTARAEIREEDLHALIDGELDAQERARIEAIVEDSALLRDRVARYRADTAMLKSVYGAAAAEPLPRQWIARIEAARTPWRRPALLAGALALAASLVLVIAGAIAWRSLVPSSRDDVVADALAARSGQAQPQSVVPGETARVLAENHAMSTALDARVKAPDLSRMGFTLAAIDVYDAPARAFELRYADRAGRIVTLYLRRSSGVPRFDQFGEHGLRVCVWQDDVIGMVMAGRVSVPEMQRLASLAYTGLEM